MERSTQSGDKEISGPITGKSGRYRNNRNAILVVIAVVIVVVLSCVTLLGFQPRNGPVFDNGDYLIYNISGFENSTPVNGVMNISIGGGITVSSYNAVTNIVETGKYLWSDDGSAYRAGNHRLSTQWGEKTVATYFSYRSSFDKVNCMILTEVGIDSTTIYRVTYFSPNMTVSQELMETNSSGIQSADLRLIDMVGSGVSKVTETATIYGAMENSSMSMWGSIYVSQGEHLRYNTTFNEGFIYFFSQDDLVKISNTQHLHYQINVSQDSIQPGEVDLAMPSGTYWYCISITNSNGGGIRPYWT